MRITLLVLLLACVVLAVTGEPQDAEESVRKFVTNLSGRRVLVDEQGNPLRRRRPTTQIESRALDVNIPNTVRRQHTVHTNAALKTSGSTSPPIPVTTFRPSPVTLFISAAPVNAEVDLFQVTEEPVFPTFHEVEPHIPESHTTPDVVPKTSLIRGQAEDNERVKQQPTHHRTRVVQQVRPVSMEPRPQDESHRVLNRGLEVDSRSETISARDSHDKPVDTIRRYSFFDTDGSYVFGYEAADGSFKEERRRLDCIVVGKYGYVDPDGVRRKFNYESGNQCDPDAPPTEEDQEHTPVKNGQFLLQTNEQQLTEEELTALNFNRQRQSSQKLNDSPRPTSAVNRDRRPSLSQVTPVLPNIKTVRPFVASSKLEANNEQVNNAVQSVSSSRFTTPATLSRDSTRSQATPNLHHSAGQDLNEVHANKINELPTDEVKEVNELPINEVNEVPSEDDSQVLRADDVSIRAPVLLAPTPKRPTPKPIAFNFNQEFSNLFKNFGRSPTNKPSTRATTRTPPSTTTTTTTTATPVTRSFDDGSVSLSHQKQPATQLVFDSATGSFRNVNVPNHFKAPTAFQQPTISPTIQSPRVPLPSSFPSNSFFPTPQAPFQQTQAPFLQATTTIPTFAISVPRSSAQVPVTATRPGFNPLPTVPIGQLIFNQNGGRSQTTSEFDKFFSQFNLKI